MMRRLALALVLSTMAACTRPVLYYPVPPSQPEPAPAPAPTAVQPAGTPVLATVASSSTATGVDYLRERQIVVPVAGAPVSSIENTFDDPRDGGRMHRAVDILSPRGTPILSADDGVVLRMSTSPLGGICLYAADPDHRLVYYYAHMDRYHDSMISGRRLAKGDTIGFVGTTGNAPKNVPHLHFQVMAWPADGKYWNGEPINPYSALVGAERATVRVTGSP
jgi:murein DD-endopeptidase MepM/ murein hydrolase activator NlpD